MTIAAASLHFVALAMLAVPQATPTTATSDKATMPKMMPMPMVAPLFLENQEFSSTLYMVNDLNMPASAQVTLFDLDGNMICMDTISFKPNSQQSVDIRELLEKFKSPATMGSLRLQPQTSSGTGILGQLSLTYYGPKTTFFDEEMLMPSMEGSSTLRAVADGDYLSAVAITSLSEASQTLTVSCLSEAGSPVTKRMSLAPNETTIVRPCAAEELTPFAGKIGEDFRTNIERPRPDNLHRSSGISITSDGMPGSFSAYGLSYNGRGPEAYFSSINFADPKMLRSSGLVYTGIPVGESSLLPSGNFTPQIFAANFSNAEAEITVQFATTQGDQTHVVTVLKTALEAQTTRAYDLNGLRGDERLQNSFIVRSNAPPGAVLSKLVARSDGTLRELDLLGKDYQQIEDAGNHPWSVENGMLSTLLLFNHSPQPTYFSIRVANDKALWLKSIKLNSMETKAISINELIVSQEKDDKGKVLPKRLLRGEVGWLSPATTEVSGRILQSDRSVPLARNFSCNNCNMICNTPTLDPFSSLNIAEGEEGELGTITPVWCSVYCSYYSSCPNSTDTTTYSNNGSLAYSWWGGGSVASLVSGSLSSSSTWQGNAPGKTTANFSVSMGSGAPYSCQSSAPVSDQVPDHLWVNTDTQGPITTCTNGNVGRVRKIQYGIQDVSNHFLSEPIGLIETFTSQSNGGKNTCTGQIVPITDVCTSSSVTGDPTGFFTDTIGTGCAAPQQGCGFTFTGQVWSWCSALGEGGGPKTPQPLASLGDVVATQTLITVDGTQHLTQGWVPPK